LLRGQLCLHARELRIPHFQQPLLLGQLAFELSHATLQGGRFAG
jgi:hypothetical protein